MKNREARQTTSLPARIRWNGRWLAANVRNISSSGLMLRLQAPPDPGTYVEIRIGQVTVAARIVWAQGEHCGLLSGAQFDLAGLRGSCAANIGIVRKSPVLKVPHRRRTDFVAEAERNRWIGSLIQHVTFVAIALSAATGIAWEVWQTMSAPAAAINQALHFQNPG